MGGENNPETRFVQRDRDFVALVDGGFADAAARSGPHLLCRPGCTQCCVGVFAIGPADVLRVKRGLSTLEAEDPERAARIRERATASWSRLAPEFPGSAATGALVLDSHGEPSESFESFANHEICPALDPSQGTCDLYAWRPHTCRVFGPPLATSEGYGVCELCFQTATPEEVAAAAMAPAPDELSTSLDQAAVDAGASSGATILAHVLRG